MLFMSQRLQFTYIAKYLVFALLLFLYKSGLAQPCAPNLLNISFDFQQNCNTKTIQFTNNSVINSGTITSYNWNFGDGNFSTINNPQHTYLNYGVYLVSLSLTHSSGCTSTITDSVIVITPPTADFIFNFDSVCPSQLITFTNLSTGNGLTYKWFFRDGPNYNAISNTASNPSHYFNAAIGSGFQTFNIKLETKDMYGCIDSISLPLVIKQQPFVDYSENGNFRRCENVIGTISDTAIIYNYSNLSDIVGYEINWGDGGGLIPVTSTFNNTVPLTHVYNSINNFPIQIKATGINGCVNTFKDTFEIISIPLPDFTSLSFSAGCVPFSVYTVNNSTGITSNTLTFINWGDNTIDTLATGTLGGDTLYHTYTSTTCINNSQQPYNIVLTTKNECGAPFKSYGPVEVYAPPQSNVNIAIDTVCVGNPVVFQNQSIPNFCAANPRTLYTWNFGDSISSSVLATLNNPTPGISHIYNQAGVYNVSLTAENTSPASTGKPGCGSTIDSLKVYIFETYADFSFNRVCLGDTTQFTNISITPGGTINSVSWNFGDGTTSTQLNPTHVYQNHGFYVVKFSIISSLGCEDIKYDTVIIDSLPKAAFTFANTCFGDSTFFTNLSTANSDSISSVHWDFGDGNISSMLNPVHLFQDTGLYNVTLSVYNSNNCKNDTTIVLKVFANPIASFYTDTICAGYQRIFTNNSIGLNGNIVAYQWNMGDGIGSCSQIDTTYSYAGSGIYPVLLKVTDNNTCIDDTTINIYLGPVPQADFNFDTVCFGTPTHFSNSSNDNGVPIANYSWSFGDGSNAIIANPNHIYTSQSNYNVTLKVSNVNSCTDSITKNITLYSLPVADFSNNTVCQGDTTYFIQLSTFSNSNLVAWNWNFGDGNTDTTLNPVHHYQNNGNYIVNLNITDANGCNKDSSKTVIVRSLPQPSFTVTHPCIGQAAGFAIVASVPAYTNPIWNFGTNNDSSILANPYYTFNQTGNYNVKLSVTDVYGCNGDTTQTIFISPLPLANFSFDTNCLGNAIIFTDNSADSSGVISNWKWNFGDSTISNLTNPNHFYTQSGNYDVILTISNQYGCTDSLQHTVLVNSTPIAAFSSNNVTIGGTNIFNDNSIANATNLLSWQWNFGDGFTSNLQNPQHNYSQADTFNVSLIVVNSNGCEDTLIQNVIVFPLPDPDFTVAHACFGDSSYFYDNSSSLGGSIVSWKWYFGDGDSISSQNPVHKYSNTGSYTVWLIVKDINGSMDSISHTAIVNSRPIADYTFDTVCYGVANTFVDNSLNASGLINQWNWDFGNGQTSGLQNPQHLFFTTNITVHFPVTLTITDTLGCIDSITKQITVYPPVNAEFIRDSVCNNSNVQFIDISQSAAGNITSWDWNFGNGSGTSNLKFPNFAYTNITNNTLFNVRLIVSDTLGCKDSVYQPIWVHPQPVVHFRADTSCLGINTYFTDSTYSNGGSLSAWSWNFQGLGTSTAQNPVFLFPSWGVYNTTLTVTDVNGCNASITYPVKVDSVPEVNFNYHGNCASGLINFTDISIPHGTANSSWHWNFGDSYSSSLQNPVHFYTAVDTFNVTLTVGNSNGCQGSFSKQIYVNPSMSYEFYADTVCIGFATHFTDSFLITASQISTWLWNFGDGSTATIHNPQHIYNNPGIYNVSLTVVDTAGCVETINHNVKVNAKPIVDFTSDYACLGDSSHFINNSFSSSGISNNIWKFGDGGSSVISNPAHLYNNAGIFTAKLIIENNNGCIDSVEKSVNVINRPIAGFSVSNVCSDFPVIITDTSTALSSFINTWKWNFGDGDSLFISNPGLYTPNISHTYNNPGNYIIKLLISNNVCSDTAIRNIEVYHNPIAAFSVPDNCLNQNTLFSDTSVITGYPIVSRLWSFGDGGNSNLQNPTHLYSNSGNYIATLSITDSRGCVGYASRNLNIYPLPQANFTNSQTCFHDSTQFTDLSFGNGGNIINRIWNFGDLTATSSLQNPKHYYNAPKNYSVSLIIKNSNQCIDTVIHSITVDSLPQANFTNNTVCQGNQTVFTNTSVNHGSINNSWSWKFGDNIGVSVLQNPFYTYQNHGIFYAKLLVTNQMGCKDSVIKAVQVDTIPLANFKADSVCLGLPTHFTNLSQSYGNLSMSYLWNFGDNTATSTLINPTHIYNSPGNYLVSLTATDAHGCSKSVVKNIVVYNLPVAGFTTTPTQFPASTSFTNTSAAVANTSIINWNWNFGNGIGTSTIQNPVYTYPSADTFNVRLIITDNHGCKDTVINQVLVYWPFIQADFGFTTACQNSNTLFSDSTQFGFGNGILNWNWNFGDSTSSSLQNPLHQYVNPGTYQVQLKVTGIGGIRDSITKTVIVYPKPIADFDNSGVCIGVNKTFTNLSSVITGNIISWNWSFGNGNTANTLNHNTVYNIFGNYPVKLIVKTDNGCIDSINKITKVHPLPTISFSSDITEGCVPIFVSFKDSSLVDSGFITNWIWDFGDGSTANTSTNITSHSYLTAGNYNVSVTARSNNTCTNTLTIPFMISVYPNPHADFDITPNTTSMLDSKIKFTDFSNGVSYWNWYFGDGDSSHVQHPTHIYNNPGDYYPLLLVTTAQGCTDTISKRVVILKDATFYAPSAFTPNNDSYNDVFQVYGIDLEKGKFEMMIFNRWGEMVFHSEDYNYGWNGSMYGNKEACPDGTYVWKIRYTDGLGRYQTAYGHVTLIR